jgi:hypothetical protein
MPDTPHPPVPKPIDEHSRPATKLMILAALTILVAAVVLIMVV